MSCIYDEDLLESGERAPALREHEQMLAFHPNVRFAIESGGGHPGLGGSHYGQGRAFVSNQRTVFVTSPSAMHFVGFEMPHLNVRQGAKVCARCVRMAVFVSTHCCRAAPRSPAPPWAATPRRVASACVRLLTRWSRSTAQHACTQGRKKMFGGWELSGVVEPTEYCSGLVGAGQFTLSFLGGNADARAFADIFNAHLQAVQANAYATLVPVALTVEGEAEDVSGSSATGQAAASAGPAMPSSSVARNVALVDPSSPLHAHVTGTS